MSDPTKTGAAGPTEDWITEWAVEVTWRDWQAAGAEGPTSQFGPFTDGGRDQFIALQRRDRDVAAIRILTRRAAYTPWALDDRARADHRG